MGREEERGGRERNREGGRKRGWGRERGERGVERERWK